MASGATYTVTINVNVTASEGSNLTNTANVSSPTSDPNPGNNSSSATTTVNPSTADLSLTKGDAPDPVATGGTLTYTVNINNLGPGPSNSITMTDTLPVGTSFVSCTPTQGSCIFSSGTVTANIGTLLRVWARHPVSIVGHAVSRRTRDPLQHGDRHLPTPDPNTPITPPTTTTVSP